jgi:hypothetical protein
MNRTTNFFRKQRKGDSAASTAVQSPTGSFEDANKAVNQYENGHEKKLSGKAIPSLTIRTFVMTILVSMGGFIFGLFSTRANSMTQ